MIPEQPHQQPGQQPPVQQPQVQQPQYAQPPAQQPQYAQPPAQQPQYAQPPAQYAQPPMQYTNPPQQVSADQTKRASQGRVIGMTILLFVLATIVAFIVFSVVTGLVVTLFIEDSEMLDFDDLGTIIAALLAGGAAMVVSYVIAAVLFVRLLLPAGQRGLPIATVLILPPVLLFALGALSAALG